MKKRSRLSILAGLSAAAGVKVSLLEALDRIEAKAQAGGNPNFAQAPYPTEMRRRRTASARRRMSRYVARRRISRYIAKCRQHRRLTRIGLSRSMISSAAMRNRQPAPVA